MSVAIELQHLSADVLGLAPWAAQALAGRPRPSTLPGMIVPDTLDALPTAGHALQPEERAELAQTLETRLSGFEPHVRVLENARALERNGVWMVIAGQQPGFLGGPLYDVYKALHVIRLAAALSEERGVPVVPAFWNHSDDHDIAEVHHLWIQNANLDLRKVGLPGVSSGRIPLSQVRFDEERHRLTAVAELLRQNLWECEAREPALELYLPRDGESFSNAFTRLLLELFGAHGLVVIEPEWIRRPLSRSLARVVDAGVGAALEAGSGALREAGSEPLIDPTGAALCFHHVDGRRNALRLHGDDFRYDEESGSRTGAELAAEIVQEPDDWSAGALLRPVVQDLTLPVIAYVGGWAELAYHAQLPPLRGRAGAPLSAFVPRLSATLVEPAVTESLATLGIGVRDALLARGRLGEAPAESGEESSVAARLRAIAAEAARKLQEEKGAVAEVDRGLAQQLKKAGDQMKGLAEKLAAKVDRVQANAAGRGRRHHRRIDNGLFPRHTPQERVRGSLEFVARWGPDWLEQLLAEIEPLPTEHVVVTLTEQP